MRCTKCHYLSFEPEPRCRNCGHDLSIDEALDFDLPLDVVDAFNGRLEDFDLTRTVADGPSAPVQEEHAPAARAAALRASSAALGSARPVTTELPLFVREMPEADEVDPEPLIRVPARPRPPIAVRRATPDPARVRAKYVPPTPEPDLLDQAEAAVDLPPAASEPAPASEWSSEPTPGGQGLPRAWRQPVSAGTRLAAAAIDAVLLGGIAVVVTFFTLRLAALPIGDLSALSAVPFFGFLLLIDAGYLLLFTAANGQTVGKMALGIRVVGTSRDAVINDRVTISQAAIRALAALPSVLALGIGFLPALGGRGLAVHDRIAHTRVVSL